MRKLCTWVVAVGILAVAAPARGDAVTFTLLTNADNKMLLPQPKGVVGVSGDHLLRTPDDITGSTFNPEGAFTFNFMNPIGIWEPEYPRGYAEGIHSMIGTFALDLNLWTGGSAAVSSLAFDGYVSPGKYSAQRLVRAGEAASNGNYGPVDGQPNSGSYAASPDSNWAFDLVFDWFFDTPYAGSGTIDMTFNDYRWDGFIIPVSQLTPAGMELVTLEDPLGFFGGTSADFEAWLLSEVRPRLPAEATWLLFAQGTAHPAWTNPAMGMTTDGLVDETIIAYTTVPEPASLVMWLTGAAAFCCTARPRRLSSTLALFQPLPGRGRSVRQPGLDWPRQS